MPLLLKLARYNKFIVAILGAIAVGFSTFGHSQPWIATVLSAISAISVYLVPNKQPTTPIIQTQITGVAPVTSFSTQTPPSAT